MNKHLIDKRFTILNKQKVSPKKFPNNNDKIIGLMGYDISSRIASDTRLQSGIPWKPEHRKFFGYR